MSLDWGKPWKPFSVTEGMEPGRANKRAMLDAMGGPDTIKKRFQTNGDGSVTMAHTRGPGTQPEFTTQGVNDLLSKLSVSMDSGTINMVGIGENDPNRYANGILHYGDDQTTAFAAKNLLGKINPPSIASKSPPEDGSVARSFAKVDEAEDGPSLYVKKVCFGQVPPSMFCGKTRLYVQAMYGADLSAWVWSPNIEGTPSLTGPADITTDSGIYTDETKHHWLLTLSGETLIVTRLKTAAKVEPLRKFLFIADADHDKIEAYILAYSLPDAAYSFIVDVPRAPTGEMFGYGWKFNWDGTKADKIVTETYATGVGLSVENKSTHFRVSVSRSPGAIGLLAEERGRWTATLSTVEGPTTWKNAKWAQVIASPIWEDGVLGIFGGLLGQQFGDAPIYCFYKRNELEVIRYTNNGGDPSLRYQRTSSPVSWMGEHDWSTTPAGDGLGITIGGDSAYGESRTRSTDPVTTGFASSVSAVATTESYSYASRALSKQIGAVTNWYTYNSYGGYSVTVGRSIYTSPEPSILPDGVPFYSGGKQDPDFTLYRGLFAQSHLITGTWTLRQATGFHGEQYSVVLIVPFYDAEAVYVRGVKSTTRNESGLSATGPGSGANQYKIVQLVFHDPFGPSDYTEYVAYPGSNYVPVLDLITPDESLNTTDEVIASSLITSEGVFDFTPTEPISTFFAGEPNDTVTQTFTTWTSCQGVVFGHGAENLLGFSYKSPFIGWA